MKRIALGIILGLIGSSLSCQTVTRVNGTQAPTTAFCAGDLIFEDEFGSIDRNRWFFENTMAGGGNWEFQWYPGYKSENLQVINDTLHFIPTLTSERYGEDFLTNGRVIIPYPAQCTQPDWYGCDRQGTPDNLINPIRSSRIDSRLSFGFRYGRVEIRAKMPRGDWLWPALWLMPMHSVYGEWPRSGEIDLMELRGNEKLMNGDEHVGVQQVGHTMHFGPIWSHNGWPTSHSTRNQNPGYDEDFHRFQMTWNETGITFFIDEEQTGHVPAGEGFWERGNFQNSGYENPWTGGDIMAPFDQEFYIIMNLAVGGVNYFADSFVNYPLPKPWWNGSPRAAADFWEHRHWWESTWARETDQSHMQVDYVRVWAV